MKKIMFNDRYGLTQAVLEGRKTQTRRFLTTAPDRYKLGEIVAISQVYAELVSKGLLLDDGKQTLRNSKGWSNKMFVKADLMPHRIRITRIKHERLQHITEADCMAEGIFRVADLWKPEGTQIYYEYFGSTKPYYSPYKAFAELIDRTCGKGTWEANPIVCAYSFELAK